MDNDANDPGTSEEVNLVETLVGDDKKYKTVDALAKAALDKDAFIEQMKKENGEMRSVLADLESKVNQSRGVDDVLNAIRSMSENGTKPNDSREDHYSAEGETMRRDQPSISKEDVAEWVKESLRATQQQTQAQANVSKVKNEFLALHEDPEIAEVAFRKAAGDLGLEPAELEELAAKTPVAALRALGMSSTQPTANSPSFVKSQARSEVNSSVSSGDHKPFSYWENQRKTKGMSWYFKPAVQNQIMKDSSALGDKFFDR